MTGTSFEQDLATIKSIAAQPVKDSAELWNKFSTLYHTFFNADFSEYDSEFIKANADKLISELFLLRLGLRDNIAGWAERGLMRQDVVTALRDLFRILRYATDYIGELAIGHDILDGEEVLLPAFTGTHHNTLINPNFSAEHGENGQAVQFRTGDVLLVRGTYANSAAIARIGDVDSQFSHLAIIHIDGEGKKWLVESLIEDGSIITPLDQALAKGNSRAILFRHKNAELAREAAHFIYHYVKERNTPEGSQIAYDFSMGLERYDLLFCSKLVRMAFDKASNGNVILPRFPTRFSMRNKDLIRRIGITTNITFAPGDIEVEPSFDMVAEWRDYRFTPKLRFQDLALTKMFEWMDVYDYRFKGDMTIRMISMFGLISAKLSNNTKDAMSSVIPKIPSNMSKKTIATIVMLHKTAGVLIPQLEAKQAERLSLSKKPLHPKEIFDILEDIRENSGGKIGYLKGRTKI